MATKTKNKNEITLTRIFDAPREDVWKGVDRSGRSKKMVGPKGFAAPYIKIDFKVRRVLNCMRSPEGKDFWSKGLYREIVALERLVMTESFADEKGNTVPASQYGMSEDFPLEMLITVMFEEHDGKTKLTLQHVGIPSGADSEGAHQGWNESFDKLAEYLERRK